VTVAAQEIVTVSNNALLEEDEDESSNNNSPSSFYNRFLCFADTATEGQNDDNTPEEDKQEQQHCSSSLISNNTKSSIINTVDIECIYEDDNKNNMFTSRRSKKKIGNKNNTPSLTEKESSLSSSNLSDSNSTDAADINTDSNHLLLPPSKKEWPQSPLLFRVKPNSGMKIIGIRKDNSTEYLWTPQQQQLDNKQWWHILQQEQRKNNDDDNKSSSEQDDDDDQQKEDQEEESWRDKNNADHSYILLPINNGNEEVGESFVIDFESEYFKGSMLLRLRYTEVPSSEKYDDTKGYFNDVPFKYQATIRGKFKVDIPWMELMTGTRLDRPVQKAPPKWLLWTALKLLHFFAPQLKTKIDCDQPYSVSPLGSAPRTITVHHDGEVPSDLLGDHSREEPTEPHRSLTGKAYPITDALERARARKKAFDKLFGAKKKESIMTTGTDDTTYTFQFLQHLMDYQTASIEIGTSSKFQVRELLDGQPLQFMAEYHRNDDEPPCPLWAFEIWNDLIMEDAVNRQNQNTNIIASK